MGTGMSHNQKSFLIAGIIFYLGAQEINKHVQNVYKIEKVLRTVIGVIFVVIGLYLFIS
ncbi:MAG: hypothetical protein WBD09_02410 [Halobacteriota archaeon]